MGMGKSARVKRGREVASFAKKLMFCDADSAFRCDFIIYYCGGCLIILRKVVFLWKKSNKISELVLLMQKEYALWVCSRRSPAFWVCTAL